MVGTCLYNNLHKKSGKKYKIFVSWVSVPFPEATGRLRWDVGKHSRGRADKNLWIGSSKLQQACEGKIQFILACPFTSKHLKPQILDSGSKGTKKISLTDWWTKQQESLQDAKKQKKNSIRSSSFLTQLQHSPAIFSNNCRKMQISEKSKGIEENNQWKILQNKSKPTAAWIGKLPQTRCKFLYRSIEEKKMTQKKSN